MAEIRHNVVIKVTPEKIYNALITQEGLANWWTNDTTAKPEIGFVNVFIFGKFRNEFAFHAWRLERNDRYFRRL